MMTPALVLSFVAVISYAALLVLVFRRGLRVRVNQLFALYLASMLLWQCAYILVSLSQTPEAALLGYRFSSAAATGQFILFCFFVRALLRIRNRPYLPILGALIWLLNAIVALFDQAYYFVGIHRNANTGLFVPDYGPLVGLIAVSTLGFLGFGVVSLVQGYRQASTDIERNRLRYLLIAMLIIIVGSFVNFVPSLAAYPIDVLANIISALLFSYAILRYKLLDITFVVRRGLAYSVLTVIIATVYLLSILLFERLARAAFGFGAILVPILVAMVAAVLLQPWRDKAQAWVDRLLFREKYDSQRMLQELSRQTATLIDLEALVSLMLNEICDTMRLERAAVLLKERGGNDLVLAAQRGLDETETSFRLGYDHPIVQWLQHSERPLHNHAMDMLPQFRSLWGEEKEALTRLGGHLFIPLLVKHNLVGILAVGSKLSHEEYTADDEAILSTLANQTAVAVENALLFASTKARVAELTTLQEIGVRLVAARRLPHVLRVVAESGVRLLRADQAHVALCEPPGDHFTASASYAADGSACALAADAAAAIPMRTVACEGQTVVISDLRLHAAIPPAMARDSTARAIAAFPLRREGATFGVLSVIYHQPHSFAEEELRLLGMLADQSTLAIENAQLLEAEHAKRQLADTLREVSRVMSSTLQLDLLLNLVLEQLQNVVSYDWATIALLKDGQLDTENAQVNRSSTDVEDMPSTPRSILLRELVTGRQPIFANDPAHDPRWATALGQPPTPGALIGVPLVVREETRGALLMVKFGSGRYDEDDLRNALTFANQAAMAIENARLHQETIAEKRKTETIIREALSGILVTDVDLRVVTFNSGAESITGLRGSQVLGQRLPDIFGDDIIAPGSPLAQVIATGERIPPQETVLQTAGNLRDILLGAVALRDANRELFGYLLSFADITRLKEVDRLKTDIVANVSHELRTPLASIKAYTELLLANVEGEDHTLRDQFLHIIDQETDRLAQFIGDLLDLSRFEAGRFEVRRTKLDLAEVLENVLNLLDVQRRSRGIEITTEISASMPTISADREMMTLIMRNLIANAIKFSHRGGEVVVRLWPTEVGANLQVQDAGIGIAQDALPHLFQKFYRTKSASELGIEGTGLGLVLTKQAVEAHGGSIAVESEINVGTTFTVSIPWQ